MTLVFQQAGGWRWRRNLRETFQIRRKIKRKKRIKKISEATQGPSFVFVKWMKHDLAGNPWEHYFPHWATKRICGFLNLRRNTHWGKNLNFIQKFNFVEDLLTRFLFNFRAKNAQFEGKKINEIFEFSRQKSNCNDIWISGQKMIFGTVCNDFQVSNKKDGKNDENELWVLDMHFSLFHKY